MWARSSYTHMCMCMGMGTKGCVVDACDDCGGCVDGRKGYVPAVEYIRAIIALD